MYKKNRRDISKFNGCSPLQLLNGLIGLKPAITYFAYTKRCITFSWSWQNPRCLRTLCVFWNVIHQGAKPNYLTWLLPNFSFSWTSSQNVSHLTLKVIWIRNSNSRYIKKHLHNAFQAKANRIIYNWSQYQL